MNGTITYDPAAQAEFMYYPKEPLDFLKSEDRKKICRATQAALEDLLAHLTIVDAKMTIVSLNKNVFFRKVRVGERGPSAHNINLVKEHKSTCILMILLHQPISIETLISSPPQIVMKILVTN